MNFQRLINQIGYKYLLVRESAGNGRLICILRRLQYYFYIQIYYRITSQIHLHLMNEILEKSKQRNLFVM